ncbi:MAG: hypothetical protein JXA71_18435, partial [Chitinispirillaceae bacterium]|nr:hypothetical protein [Chitinispirillaceae bacterium]
DDRLLLDYAGSFFRRHEAQDKGTGRREYGSATLRLPRNVISLLYRDEWRSDTLDNGSGLYEGGCSWNLIPLRLNEKLSFISRRKLQDGRFWSVDTGYTIRWEQSLDHSFIPSWQLKGLSSIDRTIDYAAGRDVTMLLDLTSDIDPKKRGFASKQRYRISSEIASSFIQVPVFAGKGMGTHLYDSTRREYVPGQPGDYFMQQREVYDSSANLRVRKSLFDLSWSYEPPKTLSGILNDLVWQGTLFLEEHVDAQSSKPSSFVPGYASLAGRNHPIVRYADLSYRQELQWRPRADTIDPARVRLAVTPAFRKIRGYEETAIESRLEIDRPIGRWTFGSALNLLDLGHDDSLTDAADYRVYDRRLEVSQHYRPIKTVTLSLLEVSGLAQKNPGIEPGSAVPLDSSFYYQIAPSLSWLPGSRGRVSAQYTYSVVPLQGDIDFRMARGFMAGISHQASIATDIRMGERFLILGSYRGDLRKPQQATDFEPANHLFSLEVRVFL